MIVISLVNESKQLGISVRMERSNDSVCTKISSLPPSHFLQYETPREYLNNAEDTRPFRFHYDAFQRKASLSPVPLLGCSALSGLCTRCANCGLTPIGGEISIGRSCVLTGSGGAMLFLFLPMMPNTFFFVQAVAREYLLDGETGSLAGYGGALSDFGDAV